MYIFMYIFIIYVYSESGWFCTPIQNVKEPLFFVRQKQGFFDVLCLLRMTLLCKLLCILKVFKFITRCR